MSKRTHLQRFDYSPINDFFLMLAGTFKKILFSALVFYSSQLFAEDFNIEISGSVQSGYKLYDNYSFCNSIRLNYDELNLYSKESLNINSIQRINNKRILLVLDEDYSKLDNISKISKGFKYYVKRCTNFVYMNIFYIQLCFFNA